MENIKSNAGRKRLSDEMRRTHEFTLMLNDEEYAHLSAIRNRFGSKQTASGIRSFLKDSYHHYF